MLTSGVATLRRYAPWLDPEGRRDSGPSTEEASSPRSDTTAREPWSLCMALLGAAAPADSF